jgi:ankyrin repeat protein
VKLSTSEQLTAFRDEDGQTALEIAVGRLDFVSIWILVKKGASPFIGDKHSIQPIHVAAMKGDPKLARLLIDRGADVNAVSRHGTTALDLALQHGYQDVVELLATRGANLNIKSHGLNPLIWAIRNSTHTMVRILVKNGAHMNACGEKNRNPLMEAVLAGASKGEQNVAFLLKCLRDADKSAPPPFDINQQTPEGHTALSLAYMMHGQLRKRADRAEKDMLEIIFLLQGNGARSDFSMNRYGIDYDTVLSNESMQRAVRGDWGKEGNPNARVAFTDAVKTFYDAKDQSYLSLLKNRPVSTKYEEKQEALRKSGYHNQ